MIENVIVREMWTYAFNSGWISESLTIYTGNDYYTAPKITAQTNLSRTSGGYAIASLSSAETFTRNGEIQGQPYEAPSSNDLERVIRTMSKDTILHARSVTFKLIVKDSVAASTCTIFVHSGILLNAILTSPDKIVDFLIGP